MLRSSAFFFFNSNSFNHKVSVQYTGPTFRMTSNETAPTATQNLPWRFENLREEVDALKSEHSSCQDLADDCMSSSTLRKWYRSSRCRGESSHHNDTPRSWAGQMERNLVEHPDYPAGLPLLDASEQADEDGSNLAEVSEEIAQFLTQACMLTKPEQWERKWSWSCFPLPKVPATRCPSQHGHLCETRSLSNGKRSW